MERERLNPASLAEPSGFTHGVLVEGGRTLHLAGQDASDADGDVVAPGEVVPQFDRVLDNLTTVVAEAGGDPDDVVKLTVYVTDRDRYRANLGELGDVFRSYFSTYPAMALVEVNRLFKDGAVVEVEGVAVLDGDDDSDEADEEADP